MEDYNSVSEVYASTRWPLPWIVHAISERMIRKSNLLDVGCGTGDYTKQLVNEHSNCKFFGVDISIGMIRFASVRCPAGHWTLADLNRELPYKTKVFDLAFSVNVMHHLVNHSLLFQQLNRVLKKGGTALIFTDSDQDIKARGQTKYFPETLDFNLARYPKISFLKECAQFAEFQRVEQKQLAGLLEIDEKLTQVLERKALSELRAISESGFQEGMERVREDQAKRVQWSTQITMLEFTKE
jgi:ubiquinone/menaquinone biosynthesis C-methylase UbiE